MNLTDSQKKIFAILFAAGEPLETDRLAEALAISHAEAAEQCVLLQQRLAESDLPLELRRLENSWQLCRRSFPTRPLWRKRRRMLWKAFGRTERS